MKHSPGFLAVVERAKQRIKECTIADVKARLDRGDRIQFLDVREDHEFAKDHAKGARHLGRGILERDIEHLIPDKQTEIVLYCGGGYHSALAAESLQRRMPQASVCRYTWYHSALAAESLQQMGYVNVVSMEGGIRAWRDAGYPLEQGGGAGAA